MRKTRAVAGALLIGSMATFGVGCSPDLPPGSQDEATAQWLGNGIFMMIYMAMCQANGGVCPFPLGPSDPLPPAP